jgi:hypothetical protein
MLLGVEMVLAPTISKRLWHQTSLNVGTKHWPLLPETRGKKLMFLWIARQPALVSLSGTGDVDRLFIMRALRRLLASRFSPNY